MDFTKISTNKIICSLTEKDFNNCGITYPNPATKEAAKLLLDTIKERATNELQFDTTKCHITIDIPNHSPYLATFILTNNSVQNPLPNQD